jgi:NitT/TauT family transport system substrate-binding protein
MATRRGKCTNFGDCQVADSKQVVDIPDGGDFVCSGCRHQLSEVPITKGLSVKRIIVVAAGLTVIIVIGVVLLWLRGSANTESSPAGGGPSSGAGLLGRPLRVGVVTWPGYAGGLVANNGFSPNKDCIYWNKHKLQVEFLLMEDADVRAKAFAAGGKDGVDVVWSTVDFWANELPGFIKNGVKARAVMQVDWSRGGDAIVADNSIQRIEDLKGKKISLALFTPSHWLLEYSLENSSLDDIEQSQIVKSLVGKNASPDAREDFVAGKVDAAVVWEPDVTEALQKRPGSHVLVSSQTAANLIADLMVVREDFIKDHPDVIKAFVQGWMEGTEEANRKPEEVTKLLMQNEPLYKELGDDATRNSLPTVKWATLVDNTKMFGLDGSEPMFDRIFKQAGQAWIKRGYITQTVPPDQAKDVSFLKEIYAANPIEAPKEEFKLPPAGTAPGKAAIMDKPINVYFATGSADLDPNAQQLLDQVALLAQTYSNAYIQIEGNTDNIGSADSNRALSERRAQAAVDFLVTHYGLDRNRFRAVGNGPDHPLDSNSTEQGRAKNRRTDVKVVPR